MRAAGARGPANVVPHCCTEPRTLRVIFCAFGTEKEKKKEKKKRTRSGVNSLADAADGFLRVLSFRRGSAVTNTLPPTAVVFIHKFFFPRLFG